MNQKQGPMEYPILVTRNLSGGRYEVVFTSPRREFEIAWDGQKDFFVIDTSGVRGQLAAEFIAEDQTYAPVSEDHFAHHIACATNAGYLNLSPNTFQPPFFLAPDGERILASVVADVAREIVCVWDLPDAKAYHGFLLLMNQRANRFRSALIGSERLRQAESETTEELRSMLASTFLSVGMLFPCTVDSCPAVAEVRSKQSEVIEARLYVLCRPEASVGVGAVVERKATVNIDDGCEFAAMMGRVLNVAN